MMMLGLAKTEEVEVTASPFTLLLFAGSIFFVLFFPLLVLASWRWAGTADGKQKVDSSDGEVGNDPQNSGDGHSYPLRWMMTKKRPAALTSPVRCVRLLAWDRLFSRSAVLIVLFVLYLLLASDSIQIMRAAEVVAHCKALLERMLASSPATTLFLYLNRFVPFVLGVLLAQKLERSWALRADALGRVLDDLRDAFFTMTMLLQQAA